ncbi:MAG: HAD hydrolase family protein [Candidatus Omnitrophica bacterium]|nr:HAD hydrolase family protein [Candidatus Omnitrophota bacterium]
MQAKRGGMMEQEKKKIRFSEVKLLVLDFDGVLTDNNVYVSEDGKESVCCSRSDGLGIEMVQSRGIPVVVLSKEKNKVVKARCRKLRVRVTQGIDEKLSELKRIAANANVSPRQVCYLGNDVNDLECVEFAGAGCAVNDAHPALRNAADYVTRNTGGHGAVREICECILERADER